MDIYEAIESGDPELIEKALQESGEYSESDVIESEETEESSSKQTDESASSSDEEVAGDRVIKSKSGKEEIPYEVLETARQQAREARIQAQQYQEELESLRQEKAQNEQTLETLKGRLENDGMDVESLLGDPDSITDEQWKEIEEDYGVLGKAVKQVLQNQSQIESNITQVASQPSNSSAQNSDPIQVAIDSNSDLSKWQKEDERRWQVAVDYDNYLREKPEWKNKSLDERFAEAVRLTKNEMGDGISAKQKAQEAIDKTKAPLPDSLSDVGGQPVSEKNDIEALMELSPDELAARMETLPKHVVDEILERGF